MKRLLLALASLLLGACFGYTTQEDIVLHTQFETIDEITLCTGIDDDMCIKTVDEVKELLPLELQKIIVDSTQFIEVYSGDRQDFLRRMTTEEIHIAEFEYEGVTGFGYDDLTVLYSMADVYTLIHEIAHAYEYSFWYDGTYDNPSSSAEWQDAYETEYISSYGTTNVMEFYAECFSMYFRYPQGLKMFCPKAYALLDQDLGEME